MNAICQRLINFVHDNFDTLFLFALCVTAMALLLRGLL